MSPKGIAFKVPVNGGTTTLNVNGLGEKAFVGRARWKTRRHPDPFLQGCEAGPSSWRVERRNYSCSAFNGYRREWSAYSDVSCLECGHHWRTRAKYVGGLRNV